MVFGIGRLYHGRHGRTDTRRGSSIRSGGTALTMLLCSVTDIFVSCSARTRNIYNAAGHALIAAQGCTDPALRADRRSRAGRARLGGLHQQYIQAWVSDRDGPPQRVGLAHAADQITDFCADLG